MPTVLAHGRIDGRLGVESIENGFYKDSIGTPHNQSVNLLAVVVEKLIVSQIPLCGVADIRTYRQCPVRRSHRSGHEAGLFGCGKLVGTLPREPCPFESHLVCIVLKMIVGLRNPLRRERVRLYNVGPGLQIAAVDVGNSLRMSDIEHVVIALICHHLQQRQTATEVVL